MTEKIITDFSSKYFKDSFKIYCKELEVVIDDWDQLFYDIENNKENGLFMLVSQSEEVVGFIMVTHIRLDSWYFTNDCGFVRELWVSEKYRRKGKGKQLLWLGEKYFVANKIYKSILTTHTASGFYENCGYVMDSTIVSKNGDTVYTKILDK